MNWKYRRTVLLMRLLWAGAAFFIAGPIYLICVVPFLFVTGVMGNLWLLFGSFIFLMAISMLLIRKRVYGRYKKQVDEVAKISASK